MPEDNMDEKRETVPFLHENERDPSNSQPKKRSRTAYWILSIGTLLNCFVFSSAVVLCMQSRVNIELRALPSDISDARKAVEYETRAFTGALKWSKDTGNLYREQDYSTEYFGLPTKALDDLWEELLHDEFESMTSEEAAPYLPELRNFPGKDTPIFEPGLFHSLHCLNTLRNLVSRYMYKSTEVLQKLEEYTTSEIAHYEHCMDRIRQSLICAGALTASPMYWWDGFGTALGRTGPQTCRKWQPIRDWMDGRRDTNISKA